MVPEDIPQVARIERLCFSMPWPTSAYRRELKTPETNRYIVVRYADPAAAARVGLPEPTPRNLTLMEHPELGGPPSNGREPEKIEVGPRSVWSNLLPWLKNGTEDGRHAEHESRFPMAGYAGLWLMVDEAHVTTIGVHPDHRGHGAGELLFLGLIDIAQQMKASRVTLEVRVSNLGAQALYRKYGLEIAGIRRRYYSDNGEDAYIMWSEPLASADFQDRIAGLREQLAERLKRSFHRDLPPTHTTDPTKLQ